MVVYPSQLTSEEKALRKRYAKLQEKVRLYFILVHSEVTMLIIMNIIILD